MRAEDSQALIAYRLQRAEESLQAAEIMHHNQMFTFAMNRIDYGTPDCLLNPSPRAAVSSFSSKVSSTNSGSCS